MKIDPPLLPAVFERRYKRFLADVTDTTGQTTTIHCPNTGSMGNCQIQGSPCWYSQSENPKRKLSGTLELVTTTSGQLACVNTMRPNHLVREAIEMKLIPQLRGYQKIRSEVRYGAENSRIDLLLEDATHRKCYVEVKSVTLDRGEGLVAFPDAVTERGTKHLRELMTVVEQGHRGLLFFCVQVSGAQSMEIATDIDPVYAATIDQAVATGVEVMAWRARLSTTEIALERPIDCLLTSKG